MYSASMKAGYAEFLNDRLDGKYLKDLAIRMLAYDKNKRPNVFECLEAVELSIKENSINGVDVCGCSLPQRR